MLISVLNHVAFLVNKIELVLEINNFGTESTGEIEEFPSEGTRELYIGQNSQMGKLLLMEANGPGPYQNALNKRGEGLHHIAIDVTSTKDFVSNMVGSGWFLHSKSLELYLDSKQVWLSRPGVPVLIEVNEKKVLSVESDYFIEELNFPFEKMSLCESLCCNRLKFGAEIKMQIYKKQLFAKHLLGEM